MSRKHIQDDKELFQISQVELKKLQRQYRIMEGDKNSYASEIKCYLNKQRKIISTLENEEKNLTVKTNIEKPANVLENDIQCRKHFDELLKTYEKNLRLIKQKKEILSKLNTKIRHLQGESNVLSGQGDSKTAAAMDEDIEKANKQLQLLQNKLHNETVKYDKALAENATIRQEVDALLKDRARFNELYKKLVIKLNTDKRKLLSLMEQATVACEQRDEADEKLKNIVNKDQQETTAQKHKLRELHRQLDHYTQLKEFLCVKGQKRVLADLEQKENAKKQEKIEQIEKYTQKHISILEKIKAFSGEQSVERLTAIFLKQEEENFALFNYVNEINNEVESIQDEVAILSAQLEEQRLISSSGKKERSESFETFKNELGVKKEMVREKEGKIVSLSEALNAIFKEMGNLFLLFKDGSPSLLHLIEK